MRVFDETTRPASSGLSRRQVLRRAAGGLAGALLASVGLIGAAPAARAAGPVSLRAVLKQLSPTCDPSHGIRLMLPDDGPVISLLDIVHRFYHG
jgi:hypothetical protein